MNAAIWVLVGLIVGAFILGLAFAIYMLFSVVRSLVGELRSLITTLKPVLSNEDLPKTLKAFQLLVAQGEVLGRGIEGLQATINEFYKYTFQAKTPLAATISPDSFVAGYDEEESANREIAAKLRKNGIETEEGRVSVSQSELPPVF